MVRTTPEGELHIKIVYWGIYSSGKTTILETLHRLTKEQEKSIEPVGDLKRIARESGATLYFDKGIFQSIKQRKVFYNVFTVAGQDSLYALRRKVFVGADGIIFVVDSQEHLKEENIESLRELKNLSTDRLVKEIPIIFMLNKQDLNEVFKKDEFIEILREEGLWYEPNNKLSQWNPMIYETCALFDQRKDIYRSFTELARRTGLYNMYGNGKAPIDDKQLKEFAQQGLIEDI